MLDYAFIKNRLNIEIIFSSTPKSKNVADFHLVKPDSQITVHKLQ